MKQSKPPTIWQPGLIGIGNGKNAEEKKLVTQCSEPTGNKVALALCTYKYIDAACVANLINVATKGIINAYCITSGTIVQHARNDVTNTIYESCPEFTHILYVDSDQCDFNVDSIDKLIKADKDIIAGITVQRNKPHKITLQPLQNHACVTE